MPAELPPSIAFMLDEFRGEKFTLEDVSKSLSDKVFVKDYFDQCLGRWGTSMIGNSQGETEIPLDCYLSWMSRISVKKTVLGFGRAESETVFFTGSRPLSRRSRFYCPCAAWAADNPLSYIAA